jgi:cobalt-zinc-cadmium efflux system membrane fusion protein
MTEQDPETGARGRWPLPARTLQRRRPGLVACLLLAAVGAGACLIVVSLVRTPIKAQAPELRVGPLFVRDGERIKVPSGSPLRDKLVIAGVANQEIRRKLVLPAVVEADPARTVKVLPPLAGRIIDLKVQLGSRVSEGQVLAVVDSSDLAQAYSDDAKARSVLKLTKQVLDRLLGLEKTRAVAVKDREQAQSDYAQAQAELKRAEARLQAIGVAGEQQEQPSKLLPVKAPISGSVIDLQAGLGAYLNDPTAAIMTVADLETIWVTANVPERDTGLVVKDQSVDVTLTAYPDRVLKGQVLFVSDLLDPDTRRTKVRIAFQNPQLQLKPNMFASATFFAPPRSSPVIPASALVLRDESDQVFVEVEPWVFEPRRVETAFQEGGSAVMASGLKGGERIVVKGGVLLND